MKRILFFLALLFTTAPIYSQTPVVNEKRLAFNGVTKWYYTFPLGENFNTLNKLTKVGVTLKVENGFGSTYDTSNLFDGFAEVKLRGNSTALYPKRPASVTFLDSKKKKLARPILGMPAAKGWNQLASAQDKTFMRTVFSHPFARCMGLDWSPRCRHTAVYWKNVGDTAFQYYGLFTLTEKIESGPNLPALPETKDSTTGFLVEQLIPEQLSTTEASFKDFQNRLYGFKIPDGDGIDSLQVVLAKKRLDSFYYKILYTPLWDTISGYRSISDVQSLIKYYLVEDVSVNSDAYQTSWFLNVTPSGIIGAGPFWDADGCWAVVRVNGDGTRLDNPTSQYIRGKVGWYNQLFLDPYFSAGVAKQFNAAQGDWHRLIGDLVPYANALYATGLVEQDRALYPDILSDAYWVPLPTYQDEIARMFKFVKERTYQQTRLFYDPIPARPVHYTAP